MKWNVERAAKSGFIFTVDGDREVRIVRIK